MLIVLGAMKPKTRSMLEEQYYAIQHVVLQPSCCVPPSGFQTIMGKELVVFHPFHGRTQELNGTEPFLTSRYLQEVAGLKANCRHAPENNTFVWLF